MHPRANRDACGRAMPNFRGGRRVGCMRWLAPQRIQERIYAGQTRLLLMVLVQVYVYETFDPVYQDLAAMRWLFGIR